MHDIISIKKFAGSLGVLLVATLALPSMALANDIALDIRGLNVVNRDSTYDPLSAEDIGSYGNFALGYEVIEGLTVFGEYQYGSEMDRLFGFTDFDFTLHGALLSAQYAYRLFSFFRPHARAGIGFMWGDIDLRSGNIDYGDTAFGIRLFALGGFDLVWEIGDPEAVDRRFFDHITIGLTTDLGWSFGPWLTFDELRAVDAAAGAPSVNLGEATLGGFTWDAGLTIRWAL